MASKAKTKPVSSAQVLSALKTVIDPELGVNLVDLGFIYNVKIEKDSVVVTMTLSSAFCPIGGYLLQLAEDAVRNAKGVKNAKVELVFDPPWTPEKITPEGKKQLGIK